MNLIQFDGASPKHFLAPSSKVSPECRSSVSLTLAVTLLCLFAQTATCQDSDAISFAREIRPILQAKCVMCHGGVKNAGELKLTDRNEALTVIEPGSSLQSALVERIESTEDETRMPPLDHSEPLSTDQINLIKKWIDQGAEWDQHWSFVKPEESPIPTTDRWPNWPRDPLDAWVAHGWRAVPKLSPSQPATPDQWLRKTSLALTGLPPSSELRNRFDTLLVDSPEFAYESIVDELLASPTFGEHWASVWLDQVRYADSRGLGQDGPRTIWKYRDWVIDAFNNDLPYDQFTKMQLSGDLTPNRSIEDSIATAVHRLTQTNEEGGTDDEEFRTAAVVDRINTTWQVWQGLTFGCVQCHDHPYDPFRHPEYYSFMAYLNNTSDWDLEQEFPIIQVPADKQRYAEASDLDRQIQQSNEAIWAKEYAVLTDNSAWRPIDTMQVRSNGTGVSVEPNLPNEFHTVGTVSRDTEFNVEWPANDAQVLSAIRLTLKPLDPANALLNTEIGTVLSHVSLEVRNDASQDWAKVEIDRLVVDEPEPFLNPNLSLDPKNPDGFGALARIQRNRVAAVMLKSPLNLDKGTTLRLTLAHRKFVLDAFPLVSKRVAIDVAASPEKIEILNGPEMRQARKQLSELRKQRAGIPSVSTPVVRELVEHLRRPTHVFIRGNFLTKDALAKPALPKSLLNETQTQPPTRSEMADWVVHRDNPLTARVHVNRIWARLFGHGIVVTEEDFGSSGETPTNQELLDELATRFQHRYQWSQKRLLKDIVLSATFRQSNRVTPEAHELDAENVLLARGPRIRLTAEAIRDSALSIAGLLSLKQGGAPAHPPIPDGVWAPFQAGDKWNTPEKGKADRFRRSVYTYTKRTIPYPMLAAFDAPSREFCSARRMASNTPVQALMALNDTTFQEAAKAIAEVCLAENSQADASAAQRIAWMWNRVVGRQPNPQELQSSHDYVERVQAKLGPQAAWERLALTLLNHDEMFAN